MGTLTLEVLQERHDLLERKVGEFNLIMTALQNKTMHLLEYISNTDSRSNIITREYDELSKDINAVQSVIDKFTTEREDIKTQIDRMVVITKPPLPPQASANTCSSPQHMQQPSSSNSLCSMASNNNIDPDVLLRVPQMPLAGSNQSLNKLSNIPTNATVKILLRANLPDNQMTSVEAKTGHTLRMALDKKLANRGLEADKLNVYLKGNVLTWETDAQRVAKTGETILVRYKVSMKKVLRPVHQIQRKTFFDKQSCELCRKIVFIGVMCKVCWGAFHFRCADKSLCSIVDDEVFSGCITPTNDCGKISVKKDTNAPSTQPHKPSVSSASMISESSASSTILNKKCATISSIFSKSVKTSSKRVSTRKFNAFSCCIGSKTDDYVELRHETIEKSGNELQTTSFTEFDQTPTRKTEELERLRTFSDSTTYTTISVEKTTTSNKVDDVVTDDNNNLIIDEPKLPSSIIRSHSNIERKPISEANVRLKTSKSFQQRKLSSKSFRSTKCNNDKRTNSWNESNNNCPYCALESKQQNRLSANLTTYNNISSLSFASSNSKHPMPCFYLDCETKNSSKPGNTNSVRLNPPLIYVENESFVVNGNNTYDSRKSSNTSNSSRKSSQENYRKRKISPMNIMVISRHIDRQLSAPNMQPVFLGNYPEYQHQQLCPCCEPPWVCKIMCHTRFR